MDEWKRTSAGEETASGKELESWQKVLARLGHKKEIFLLFLVFIGIMTLLWPQSEKIAEKDSTAVLAEEMTALEDSRHQLTAEVQRILSGIEGIGKVEV